MASRRQSEARRSNSLTDVEDLSAEEAANLYCRYREIARKARAGKFDAKLSIDAHTTKARARGRKPS